MKNLIIILIPCLFVACSSVLITKEQCEDRDWAAVGVQDGAKGRKLIAEHAKACSKVKAILSKEQIDRYLFAWSDSFNIRYCSQKSAYKRGLDLENYGNLNECRSTKGFSEVYTTGKKRGTYIQQINGLDKKIRELESSISLKSKRNKDITNLVKQKMEYENKLRLLERELSKIPQFF